MLEYASLLHSKELRKNSPAIKCNIEREKRKEKRWVGNQKGTKRVSVERRVLGALTAADSVAFAEHHLVFLRRRTNELSSRGRRVTLNTEKPSCRRGQVERVVRPFLRANIVGLHAFGLEIALEDHGHSFGISPLSPHGDTKGHWWRNDDDYVTRLIVRHVGELRRKLTPGLFFPFGYGEGNERKERRVVFVGEVVTGLLLVHLENSKVVVFELIGKTAAAVAQSIVKRKLVDVLVAQGRKMVVGKTRNQVELNAAKTLSADLPSFGPPNTEKECFSWRANEYVASPSKASTKTSDIPLSCGQPSLAERPS